MKTLEQRLDKSQHMCKKKKLTEGLYQNIVFNLEEGKVVVLDA